MFVQLKSSYKCVKNFKQKKITWKILSEAKKLVSEKSVFFILSFMKELHWSNVLFPINEVLQVEVAHFINIITIIIIIKRCMRII